MARRDVPYPYEADITLKSTEQSIDLLPLQDPSLLGTRYEFLAHDSGRVAGSGTAATCSDAQFKIVPQSQVDAMGGDVWQTPAAAVSEGADGMASPQMLTNALPLGFIAKPGEVVRIFYRRAGADQAVRLRIQRTRLYEARHIETMRSL